MTLLSNPIDPELQGTGVASNAPWSAAFISYIVSVSIKGPQGTQILFPTKWPWDRRAESHTGYSQVIRQEPAIYQGEQGWLIVDPYNGGAAPTGVSIQKGDIVIRNRGSSNLIFRSPVWDGDSHADIAVEDASGGQKFLAIGGNGGPNINIVSKKQISLQEDVYFVILRPRSPGLGSRMARIAEAEYKEWQDKGLTENSPTGRLRVQMMWQKIGLNIIPPLDSAFDERITRGGLPPGNPAAVSPFIHSIESFHPNIQYELTRRRIAANTAVTHFPFVKLTSLTNVLSDNLDGQAGAWCPSLGIHGETDVAFTDIYFPKKNKSIIGYAITRKPNISEASNTNDPENYTVAPVVVKNPITDGVSIPTPGITSINVERGTAGPMGVRGGLVKADLKIAAYSVGQLDALLRYFLRPATRVVLEIGRMESDRKYNTRLFQWKQPKEALTKYFEELITDPSRQDSFINQYVYQNEGRYELFLGYVVKFNVKYTKTNVYEIDLTVHSVQQFEIPSKHTGVKSTCPDATRPCKVADVQEYFNGTYAWKDNSFNKLIEAYQGSRTWGTQIIPIKNGATDATGANSDQAGTRETEYYISWRFFVDKLLNDPRYGIASILAKSEDPNVRSLADLGLLRQTADIEGPTEAQFDGLKAGQVGYHPALRSVDPGVMIIYNPQAQSIFERSPDKQRFTDIIASVERKKFQQGYISSRSTFKDKIKASSTPFSNGLGNSTEPGASSLAKGVWLNTGAIKQAFTSADTISAGIDALLGMMNSATEGYWNLQLYSTDTNTPGMHVIDMGLSKPPRLVRSNPNRIAWIDMEEQEAAPSVLDSINKVVPSRYRISPTSTNGTSGTSGVVDDRVVNARPKYIYMFNRKTKRFPDGELGSDLIDLNVEFNLPQVVAVQAIANVGGPAQKSLLQSIDLDELKRITLLNNLFISCNDAGSICQEEVCQDSNIQEMDSQLAGAARVTNQQKQFLVDALARYGAGIRPSGSVDLLQQQIQARLDYYNTLPRVSIPGDGPSTAAPDPNDDIRLELARLVRASGEAMDRQTILSQDISAAKGERAINNPNLINILVEYADLGTLLEFIEINPSRMLKKLNIDSTNAEDGRPADTPHAFNTSNLTKTTVDLTLPGIGGIQLFQSFLVDRVPSILDRGYYVVTKIVHEFTTQSGWITKIQGRFRYRPEKKGEGATDPCAT